jgi:hypothetical protein
MFGYDRTWWRFLQKWVMRITVDINVCTTSMMFTQLYIRVGILLTCWKHWKTWAHITSLLLYFLLTKWSRLKNILLYKMYPSCCINCIVSLQGQIPTFILVTCLPCISSDNKNNVKRLSFLYLDSKKKSYLHSQTYKYTRRDINHTFFVRLTSLCVISDESISKGHEPRWTVIFHVRVIPYNALPLFSKCSMENMIKCYTY